jgi:hypothetical protein
MITHILLIQWRDSVSDQDIEDLFQELRKLKTKGVKEVKAGQNFSPQPEGFTHAVVVTCKNKESFDNYRTSAKHVIIMQRIQDLEAKSAVVDFES